MTQTMATALATSAPIAAVALSGSTKSYGGVRAVRGIDLTIAPGEIVAFLGPNAAGKSTTLPEPPRTDLPGWSPSDRISWLLRRGRRGVLREGFVVRAEP